MSAHPGGTEATTSASGPRPPMTRFDDIYDLPDPRAFFRALGAWQYQTPHHAQPFFRRLVDVLAADGARGDRAVTVLDICCSYGINAALLNHDLTLQDLYAHYTDPAVARLTTAELIARDRAYYAARRRPGAARVIGLDVAHHAVDYACAVGLLDAGFCENLETTPPSAALLSATSATRLITVTGGVSFLSPRSFRPFLADVGKPPWVAAFVLRTGSYQTISHELESFGLVTEKDVARTYPQRRFTSPQEQQSAIDAVAAAHEGPEGKETDGYFHTALHLSRPAEDIAAIPLAALTKDATDPAAGPRDPVQG
ncbi:hypothetical protein ACFVYR_09000 [Streptomyces sp. NPDC058284]|uniref:hypothetical protein n=1 Tax=unclassified Streptomyces TaxID=2593676 RepID=UPI00366791A8